MRYEEVTITRDCAVIQIPQGHTVMLAAGTPAVITQALGDTYTIEVPTRGGLYRIDGKDADAIGKAPLTPRAEAATASPGDERPVDEQLIWNQLRNVYDPEIPVNIVELGLVYDLRIERLESGGSRVVVKMTLTAPGCGMGEVIALDAKSRIESLPGVEEADVDVVFDPPWNQQMMSEAAKLQLGML
ncbi:MAG: putative Fe-S cluster assembly protein SufT [Candidatus Binatia bacterium]